MHVLDMENVRTVDVDDTLVMHAIPLKKEDEVKVTDPYDGRVKRLTINHNMVRLVREEYIRGSCIVVWSRGGAKWAKAVVEALGLQDAVHMIMSKPHIYFDDKPVYAWLTDRVYIPPQTLYKPE